MFGGIAIASDARTIRLGFTSNPEAESWQSPPLMLGLFRSAVQSTLLPPCPSCSRSSPTRAAPEVDGSGTVGDNIRRPERLVVGSRFTTKMRMYGVPYRMTSTVTALKPDQLIDWRHPFGHRWRWEFHATSPTSTRVTETFDYRDAGRSRTG